jgi:hypothetical protein
MSLGSFPEKPTLFESTAQTIALISKRWILLNFLLFLLPMLFSLAIAQFLGPDFWQLHGHTSVRLTTYTSMYFTVVYGIACVAMGVPFNIQNLVFSLIPALQGLSPFLNCFDIIWCCNRCCFTAATIVPISLSCPSVGENVYVLNPDIPCLDLFTIQVRVQ